MRVVLPDVRSPAVVAKGHALGKVRRLYITKSDLINNGLTGGCAKDVQREC